MFRKSRKNSATDIEVTLQYQIERNSKILEDTKIIQYCSLKEENKSNFRLGNYGKIKIKIFKVIDNSIVLEFESNENIKELISIPNKYKYEDIENKIIVKKGNPIIIEENINWPYKTSYKILVKEIKYGECLEL